VLAELYTGLKQVELEKAEGMIRDFGFLSTNPRLGRLAGALRKRHGDQRVVLSLADPLIAATAIDYNVMLITHNQKDFPVPELRLRPAPPAL